LITRLRNLTSLSPILAKVFLILHFSFSLTISFVVTGVSFKRFVFSLFFPGVFLFYGWLPPSFFQSTYPFFFSLPDVGHRVSVFNSIPTFCSIPRRLVLVFFFPSPYSPWKCPFCPAPPTQIDGPGFSPPSRHPVFNANNFPPTTFGGCPRPQLRCFELCCFIVPSPRSLFAASRKGFLVSGGRI